MYVSHVDPENPQENTILVGGLRRDLTLVHVTDSHVVACDARDPDARDAEVSYSELFQGRTPGNVPPRQMFAEVLSSSARAGADCTALTGDIIHFPSWAAVETIQEELGSLSGSFLYTLGNHDWFFPYLEWNEQTRESHYPRFHALMGQNPACQVREIEGLLLVGLDNSNYQVTPAQLAFLQQQLQDGRPCFLFMHMPLFAPSLIPSVMERWEAPIVMAAQEGWTDEGRAKWNVRQNDPSTQACYELLSEGDADNLVGICAGHVHFSRADAFRPERYQYVTGAAFEGVYRVLRLKPRG